LPDPKHDETFKVVDRRLFTPEGEFRRDVAEQQDREHETASSVSAAQAARNASPVKEVSAAAGGASKNVPRDGALGAQAAGATVKRSAAFENLIRSLGQNAAMMLGGYADPGTGQPMVDLEGAREMIDMLDALREKTTGNLAPEEDTLILDIAGNLKLAFMEMTKAATAAAVQEKAKSRT
jgi:hypothetical protein